MILEKNNFYFLNNVSSVPFCEHMHAKFAKSNNMTTEKYSQQFHISEFYDGSKFQKMQNFMMIPNVFKIWPKKVTSTCKHIAKTIESGKAQNLYNLIFEHFFEPTSTNGTSRKSAFLKSRTILWRNIFWGHTCTSGKL
jgi:hypothetical protein